MRRRDVSAGLLLAVAARTVLAQERAKQHRIAIVIPTGPAAGIGRGDRLWLAFFQELRRLGDVEGLNLTVERYSGDGRPEGYPDLAREVVSGNHAVIVAAGNAGAEQQQLDEASRQLEISLIDMVAREATPSELRRVFTETGRSTRRRSRGPHG